MSIPIFGRLLDEETVEFGRVLDEKPEKSTKISKFTPISERPRSGLGGKAIARGGLKALRGILELAEMAPAAPKISEDTMGDILALINLFKGTSEEAPQERGPFEEQLEAVIPRGEEYGFPEKAIERGTEILPYLFGGGSQILPKVGRALLAGALSQTAEELGGGEIAQTAAEIAALGAPGLGKKIIPKKIQKEAVEALRRRGVSEKVIAPLIPSERKSALLGKVGVRNFRTSKAAKRTRGALGDLYSQLAQEGEKLPILSSNRASRLKYQLTSKIGKMPSSVRRAIKEDLNDLFKKPVKSSDLMNFWQDINSQINWKTIGGGKKRLNSLKDIILEGIKDISPQLARDFELTNLQYSKFNKLYKNLKPESLDRWMALGKLGALLGGLFKFGPKAVTGVIGTDALRRLSSEMLINPRLQNLTLQMGRALNNNKLAIAKKIQDQMIKELKKQNVDLSIGNISDKLP